MEDISVLNTRLRPKKEMSAASQQFSEFFVDFPPETCDVWMALSVVTSQLKGQGASVYRIYKETMLALLCVRLPAVVHATATVGCVIGL